MRTCGVEITGSDVLLCILSKDNDVFDIRDVRQTRFTLGNGNDTEVMRKFQFDFAKLTLHSYSCSRTLHNYPHLVNDFHRLKLMLRP